MKNFQLKFWQPGLCSPTNSSEPLSTTSKNQTHALLDVKAVYELLRDFEPELLKHSDETEMLLDMIHEYLLGKFGKSLSKIIEDSVSPDCMIALTGMKSIVKKHRIKDLTLLDIYLEKQTERAEAMIQKAQKAQFPEQMIATAKKIKVQQLSIPNLNQTYYERSQNPVADLDRSQWQTEEDSAAMARQTHLNHRGR